MRILLEKKRKKQGGDLDLNRGFLLKVISLRKNGFGDWLGDWFSFS